ncbi:hypothetical protein COV19_02935 [Candidatus Woesearchaeota archaeon CG10_big_fil_rev_8_21_14_0_10_44_13]|nr:MAG: hypothetical protein COV19_02935 [Candidatus Woesearchaeota archaeon CG10_big_fil_rev_8_21_14_0_10_44_13]
MSIRKIRERLNKTVENVPYIGKVLTSEITLKDLVMTTVAAGYLILGRMDPAKAGPRVNVESMYGEDEDVQTMTLDTKIWGTIEGKLDYFLRNRTPIDMNSDADGTTDDNMVGPSMTLMHLNYEIFKGFDIVAAAKLTTGAPLEERFGIQYTWTKNGFLFYTLATRKINEDPNTEWKSDLGYSGPLSGNFGWRTNWEQLFTFPDGQTTTNSSRIRLGVTYKMPGSGTILSLGPAMDINNIQNGENAATNPRTMMPGAYLSVDFK